MEDERQSGSSMVVNISEFLVSSPSVHVEDVVTLLNTRQPQRDAGVRYIRVDE